MYREAEDKKTRNSNPVSKQTKSTTGGREKEKKIKWKIER